MSFKPERAPDQTLSQPPKSSATEKPEAGVAKGIRLEREVGELEEKLDLAQTELRGLVHDAVDATNQGIHGGGAGTAWKEHQLARILPQMKLVIAETEAIQSKLIAKYEKLLDSIARYDEESKSWIVKL